MNVSIRVPFSLWLFLNFSLLILFFGSCKKNPATSPEINPPDTTQIITNGPVQVWVTKRYPSIWFSQQYANFSSQTASFSVSLDSTLLFQEMDGFGAALTGSSAYLLKNMDEATRTNTLRDLFDPETGIGINYLRVPIGSSDFSLGNYTYCDQPDINKFAIPDLDERDLLPVLKEILRIAPDIKLLASPWSAPAWMKNTNNLYGGRLKSDTIYDDFAMYLVKYVEAFESRGIHFDAITIQNEPHYETIGYPTMYMDWGEQNNIIKKYLGPEFKNRNITTKILIWDHNFDGYSYPINILDDSETLQYVAGTAFHGYGGTTSQIKNVTNLFPDKGIYFTELSGGGWNTDDPVGNMLYYMEQFLIPSVNLGSKNFLMWNLALNSNNGPVTTTNGGCQNCRGVITIPNAFSFSKNEEYYLIGHFSKFVRKGAKRIKAAFSDYTPSGMSVSAFMNTDGSKVAVIMNRTGSLQNFTIRCGNRKFTYTLSTESVASFVFK